MRIQTLLKVLFLWVVLAIPSAGLGGCHTWEGLGEDIERTGQKMQGDDDDDDYQLEEE